MLRRPPNRFESRRQAELLVDVPAAEVAVLEDERLAGSAQVSKPCCM